MILIIAILAGLLLPSLQKAMERGREISCRSNFKQIGSAILMYSTDNNEWVPFASCYSPAATMYMEVGSSTTTVRKAMLIYFTSAYMQKQWNTDGRPVPKVYVCPSGSDDEYHYISGGKDYGTRGNISTTLGVGFINYGDSEFRTGVNTIGGRNFKKAKQPSQYGLIFDARTKYFFDTGGLYGSWTEQVDDYLNPVGRLEKFPLISFRHNMAFNLLMADGHVEGGFKFTMPEVKFRRHFWWHNKNLLTSANEDIWWSR